jgi:protein tyrosine/serine phosphatase
MSQHDQPDRILSWDACYNVRDIGGYPVGSGRQTRWHVITRADNLNRLTPDGQAALRAYGVRTVIDLRLAHELERHPNPFADHHVSLGIPRYLNLPLHDPEANAAMDLEESMEGEYIVILERSKPLIAAVIHAVAEALEEGGVVVHCHGGKDRTGIVVALLLSVAGVPRETIIEDYALSEAQLEPVHSAWLEEQSRTQGQPVARPRWMHSRPETMRGVLDFLDREYSGPVGYLEAAGVPHSTIAQIRNHLLAPVDTSNP